VQHEYGRSHAVAKGHVLQHGLELQPNVREHEVHVRLLPGPFQHGNEHDEHPVHGQEVVDCELQSSAFFSVVLFLGHAF